MTINPNAFLDPSDIEDMRDVPPPAGLADLPEETEEDAEEETAQEEEPKAT